MKHTTLAGTLAVLAIVVLLNMAQARSAPSASASSLGPRQEVQQLHQQSGEPALTSLTVTADGTTQPLAPAFSSTVKYYTVVVDTAVTRITVSDQDEAGTLYPSVFAPVVNCSWEVAGALRVPTSWSACGRRPSPWIRARGPGRADLRSSQC